MFNINKWIKITIAYRWLVLPHTWTCKKFKTSHVITGHLVKKGVVRSISPTCTPTNMNPLRIDSLSSLLLLRQNLPSISKQEPQSASFWLNKLFWRGLHLKTTYKSEFRVYVRLPNTIQVISSFKGNYETTWMSLVILAIWWPRLYHSRVFFSILSHHVSSIYPHDITIMTFPLEVSI